MEIIDEYKICREAPDGPCARLINDRCELGCDPNNETCWASRNGFTKNIAKCPTCGSERIVRISPGGKVFKIAALGIFGLGDVHKIFRCLSCGYKW